MAAVAHAPPAEVPRLVLIRTAPPAAPAVPFRPTNRYRRRRAFALLVVVSVLAGLLLAVQVLFASFGGSAAVNDPPASRAAVYVVQPGDTFWDIARRLRPDGDPRPLVARMVAEHGGAVLVAGERLPLPAAA